VVADTHRVRLDLALRDPYRQAARNFQRPAETLRYPLYLVPGNHDVGDKPAVWALAATVTADALELWRQQTREQIRGWLVSRIWYRR
jgi:hypothetical protein